MVLLVASGLMVRTFQSLRAVEPGFDDPARLQLVGITIPNAEVRDAARVLQLQRDLRDRLAAIPGVTAASFTRTAPMEGPAIDNLLAIEDQGDASGRIPRDRRFQFVSPGFFETAGIRFVAGRDLTWDDLQARRPVALISENFAREVWGHPDAALHKRVRENAASPWREIVGVVGDVHDDGLHRPAPSTVYWPAAMARFWGDDLLVQRSATFAVRSGRAGTDALLEDVRTAVHAVLPNVPMTRPRTLGDVYARSLGRTTFTLVMLLIAAATALLLGIVGIAGTISYAVTARTREIGIRVALGARHSALTRAFVRDGVLLAAIGVACGLAGALPLARVMTALLFGVGPLDPVTYGVVAVVLMTAAAIASYVPAHRAMAIDPVEALRRD